MVKTFAIIALILIPSSARAENSMPWFGGAAVPPEQITTIITVSAPQTAAKTPDCAIYDCASLVKIGTPEEKSAANP